MQLNEAYLKAIETLDGQTKALMSEYHEQIQCQKGCASCCKDNFRVRFAEILPLLDALKNLPEETLSTIRHRLNHPEEKSGVCPLLIDNQCSVYLNRPILCRAYGLILSLGDTISTCHLNFQDMPQMKNFKILELQGYYELFEHLSNELWNEQPDSVRNGLENPPFLTIRDYLQFLGIS